MRLTKIKLAGFKSFVDPTTITLPGKLIGIVGPNGCGKSNTIDAVRWVMGESSAKHLRGESMDDVIFTGSSTRKPVSQASVELVFDNSDGSLGGEYARYNEIALRREVSRDGQSRYLLNNTRCRRRDIRDIFLGTGLGPRSYAIIEQGMISRLIEAKPEDLRVYLEEAAGISKYRERRRETETRIRHTRDNLDRLDDLREEVDKQIAHLKRQANTAERFKLLKAEERELRGQLLGLRWGDYQAQLCGCDALIRTQELSLEQVTAELRTTEASIELDRQHQSQATTEFNLQQGEYYRVGSEVSRVEQSITHTRESRAQQSSELAQIEESLQDAEYHIRQDRQRIDEIDSAMAVDEPAYDQALASQKYSAQVLAQAEAQLHDWQNRHVAWTRRHQEATQTAQIELSRMDQLERGVSQLDARLDRLRTEQLSLDAQSLKLSLDEWVAEEVNSLADEERLQGGLERVASDIQTLRDAQQKAAVELDAVRGAIQVALGRKASLEALQQAALGQNDHATTHWLERLQLADRPRLAQCIRTEPKWQKAVEVVLGGYLEAVCVDAIELLGERLGELDTGRVTLLESLSDAPGGVPGSAPTWLLHQVESTVSLHDLLAGVHVTESLPEAMVLRQQLGSGESVVTCDGLWLGPSWIRVGTADLSEGILEREQEIQRLGETLDLKGQQAEVLRRRLEDFTLKLDEHETRRDTLQHAFNQCLRQVSEVKSRLAGGRQQLEQLLHRERRLAEELLETRELRRQDEEQIKVSRSRRAEALELINELNVTGEDLQNEHDALNEELSRAREQAETDRSDGQAIAIRVESMRTARRSTAENLARVERQIQQFAARREQLTTALATAGDQDPVLQLEAKLATLLDTHLAAKAALEAARSTLETVEERLRAHEQTRTRQENQCNQVRDALQNERMESQEVRVRLKTIEEKLIEEDFRRDEILADMPEHATVLEWTQRVEEIDRRIQRLGPINLAAIDEYDEQLQRKHYLDAQHTDVTDALATLEKAIAKIDRETRHRFRETFDRVNEKVQQFFPRLFGGGQAQLAMTGDDLLSTGVTILAQPPGKHVANIHLLSGGEKALTAVAMVFAFFELNPSPFCLLDEVDAPLDDANVGRFCELVREMSERVQFVFITHNKVTMELAQQLMGVTMNEPGVSRLVAVDVQEAVELAGS